MLAKSVLYSIEHCGYFDRPTSIAWKGRSLRYFRSLLNRIFDKRTGVLLDSPDPEALRKLRCLCEYCYKLALPYKDELLEEATESFISHDEHLGRDSQHVDTKYIDMLRKRLETHYDLTRDTIDTVFQQYRPRFTPGTFSGKTFKSHLTVTLRDGRKIFIESDDPYYVEKFSELRYPPEYEAIKGFFRPYPGCNRKLVRVPRDTAAHSELLFVNKDARGPRTIIREPLYRLFVQMSFHDWLKGKLEKVTSNRVNFQSQEFNRSLALSSSINKEYATIDLSKASDSVSVHVIRMLVKHIPALRWFIVHRSEYVSVDNGEKQSYYLNKVAGMGSGLTFPLMSLLIHLVCSDAIATASRGTVSFKKAMRLVYVYGDDIIVPTKYYDVVVEGLQKVLLVPNKSKSFRNSHFRESCGGDYFNGEPVSPVRLKLQSCELESRGTNLYVDGNSATLQIERHCRELVHNSMPLTANFWYELIEKQWGKLPVGSGDTPYLVRWQEEIPAYKTVESGEFETVKVVLPTAAVDDRVYGEQSLSPYFRLGTRLRKISKTDTLSISISAKSLIEDLAVRRLTAIESKIEDNAGLPQGLIAVPRSCRYKRKRVSAWSLMR